jgi:hypothetical protein
MLRLSAKIASNFPCHDPNHALGSEVEKSPLSGANPGKIRYMTARVIQPAELPAFDALASEFGSLFTRAEWTRMFKERLVRVGLYDRGGSLLGGFNCLQTRRLGLRYRRNPPFTPDCGPFLKVLAEHPVAVLEAHRDALSAMVDFLRADPAALTFLRLSRATRDVMPFYHAGFRAVPAYTYILPLNQPANTLLDGMASVRRRNLQRASKDGLVTKPVADMKLVFDLVCRTFARQRKAVDTTVLRQILFEYAQAKNSFAFATFQNSEPLATAFVVHDGRTAFYLLGGYNDEGKHHGAGPAAMWSCIRRAQELGLQEFDFEGSMIPAIERYFRGFGGRLTPFFTVNRAWFPLEILLKCRRRNLF